MKKVLRFTLFLIALFLWNHALPQVQSATEVNYASPSTITIDGVIDAAWSNYPAINITRPFTGESPTLNSAIWKAAWNEDGIYVVVSVEDDLWFPYWLSGMTGWQSDHVELYFDLSDPQQDGGGPGDGSYRDAGNYQVAPDMINSQSDAETTSGDTPGVIHANTFNGTGNYIREYFVPWTALLVYGNTYSPSINDVIGFDVCVIDCDAVSGSRNRMVWSNDGSETTENWNNCDKVGLITLTNSIFPVADFAADVYAGNASLTVHFTDLSTNNPTNWSWDFNNDGIEDSDVQNPSFTFTHEGIYNISLSVTNEFGTDTETKVDFIRVTSKPVAAIENLGPHPITIDGTVDSAWDLIPGNPIEKPFVGETPTIESAEWKAYWDLEGVYVLVSVQDDIWMPLWLSEAAGWASDHVELYFDVTTPQEDGGGAFSGNGNVQIAPDMIEQVGKLVIEPNGVQHANTYDGDGNYIREYFVPYTAFPNETENAINPWNKNIIGFDVYIADRDATDSEGGSRNRLVWSNDGSGYGESYYNCNDVGLITFYAEPIPQDIQVETTFDFGDEFINGTKTVYLDVFNNGLGELKIGSIVSSNPDIFHPEISQIDLGKKEIYKIPVTFSPIAISNYSATITISSNDPDEPSVIVTVSGKGVEAPVMNLAPSELTASVEICAGSDIQQFNIENAGQSNLEFYTKFETGGFNAAHAGQIISAYQGAYGYYGMVWAGNKLALIEYCSLYIYDTITLNYQYYSMPCQLSSITYDGSQLWIADRTGKLKNYDLEGKYLGTTINMPFTGENSLVWNGECFLAAKKDNNPIVYKVNKQGEILGQNRINSGRYIYSFCYANNHTDGQLWTRDNYGYISQLELINGQYETANEFNAPANTYEYLFAYNGTDFWFINNDNNLLKVDDGIEEAENWVSLSMVNGTIAPSVNTNIDVTFNSEHLNAGVYNTNIIVKSNDPLKLTDTVKCNFTVNGDPGISINKNEMKFGRVFVNATATDTLIVKNTGCDTLKINGINATDNAFTTSITQVNLMPKDSILILVYFNPQALGYYSGHVLLSTNAGNKSILVNGKGVEAPELAITNKNLTVDITHCSGSETDQYTIENNGNGELTFDQTIVTYGFNSTQVGKTLNQYSNCYPYNGMTKVGDLFYYLDYMYLYSYNPADNSTNYVQYLGRNSSGIAFDGEQLWVGDTEGKIRNYNLYGDELGTCIQSPFGSRVSIAFDGNNLLISGINIDNPIIYKYNRSGNQLASSSPDFYCRIYSMIWAPSHMQGELWALTDNYTLSQIKFSEGTYSLINNYAINYSRATSLAYDGKDLWLTNDNGVLSRIDDGVIEPDYITLSKISGKIAANSDKNIDVTLDASNLAAGTYHNGIVVHSDDPLAPTDTVDLILNVSGNPDIHIAESNIDFGEVYQNDSSVYSLMILNTGCDTLRLTDISTSVPQFSVPFSDTLVAPNDSIELWVKFKPDAVTGFTGNLVILNNSGDITITLTGDGVEPPVINIDPSSLTANVKICGASDVQQFNIENTGLSDLKYATLFETGGFDAAHAGQIIRTYPGAYGYYGMVWAGNKLALIDYCSLYIYDTITLSCTNYSMPCQLSAITYDGNQLWIADRSGKLKNYDLEGNYLGSIINLPFVGETNLTWNGECFLVAKKEYDPIVYKINKQGKVIGQNRINIGRYIYSFCYANNHANGHLWTRDNYGYISQLELINGLYETANEFYAPSSTYEYMFAYNKTDFWFYNYSNNLLKVDDGIEEAENWITLSMADGTITPSNNQDIDVTFNSEHLIPGVYSTNLIVKSNDPLSSSDTIAIEFTVENVPVIQTSVSQFVISDANITETTSGTFEIENLGCSILTISDISSSKPEFTITNTSFDVLPGESQTVYVDFEPTSLGTVTADLTISNNDEVKIVQVTANGVDNKITSVGTAKSDGNYKTGEVIDLLVTFENTVTVNTTGGTPKIALNTNPISYATYTSGSGTNELTFTYTVGVGDNSQKLDYTSIDALTLEGGTIMNGANNSGISLPQVGTFSNVHNIVIDNTAPTATLSSTSLHSNASGVPVLVTITFNEPVNGFDLTDISVSNATIDNLQTITNQVVYSFDLTPSAEGDYSAELLASAVTDLAGNANTAKSNKLVINHDLTPPTLVISSSEPDPTNKTSFTINFNFSEDVTDFTIGDIYINSANLSQFSGSGSSYSVKANLYWGGTFNTQVTVYDYYYTDLAGNWNETTSSFEILCDNAKPYVYLSTSESTPTNNSSFKVTIGFSEEINGLDLSDIQVANGSASNLVEINPGLEYTADITVADEGDVNISIPADMLTDEAGNKNNASNALTINYDTTNPTVVLTSEDGSLVGASNIEFTAEFSEIVTGFGPEDITIDNGTILSVNATNNGSIYRIMVDPIASGDITLQIEADKVFDLIGLGNLASNTLVVTCDITTPSVTISTTAPAHSNIVSFDVDIDFSEAISGFDAGDISVENGTVSNYAVVTPGTSYTCTITAINEGNVKVRVDQEVAADNWGNTNTASNEINVDYDITKPIASISSNSGNITNQSPFTVTIGFNEPVNGFTIGDLTIGNGTASNLQTVTSNQVFTVNVTPAAQGNVTIDLAASTATDLAGNNSQASGQLIVNYDITLPTVAITSSAPATTNTSPIYITVTFSENVTGFSTGDILVTNGTASNLAGSGNSYTADITPTADGTVTVNINAGVAIDAAGNGNTAATTLSLIFDTTGAIPTISSAYSNVTSQSPFTVQVAFNESVTGFELADLTVSNGSASNLQTVTNNLTYTVNITPVANGAVTIDLPINKTTDVAGNGNQAATYSINFDNVQPTVTISTTSTSPTNQSPLLFSIVFNEEVTGFDVSDITTSNGTAGNLTATVANKEYTFTVTPITDGEVAVSVNPGVFTDMAGNLNQASNQVKITFDTTKPTVTLAMDSKAVTYPTFTVDITFSEQVTGFDVTDITTGNDTLSNFIEITAGISYKVDVTPISKGKATVDIAADVVTDIAGNKNTAAAQLELNYSTTAPVPDIYALFNEYINTKFMAFIAFDKQITGFTLSDLVPGNAVLSDLSEEIPGMRYSFSVAPVNQGLVTIDLPASVVTDIWGYQNIAAEQFSITYDSIAPVATLTRITDSITNVSPIVVKVDFNEKIQTLALANFNAGNGSLSNLIEIVPGKSFTVDLTPVNQGDVLIQLTNLEVQDLAGNYNQITEALHFTYDTLAPEIELSTNSASITNESEISVYVRFDEAISGFTASDVTLLNATIIRIDTIVPQRSYNVLIRPVQNGEVQFFIPANKVNDVAGNENDASDKLIFRYDNQAPTVVLTSNSPEYFNTTSIVVNIEFSEGVQNLITSDLNITNGTVLSLLGNANGKLYTANIVPETEGEITVSIGASAATDSAGNANTNSNQLHFVYDKTAPVISSIEASNITDHSADIVFVANENGELHYALVLKTDNLPGVEEVINGSVASAISQGNYALNANQEMTMPLNELNEDTDYILCGVTLDILANHSELLSLPFKTTKSGIAEGDFRSTKIYPNPSSGLFTIYLGNDHKMGDEVLIFDASSRLIRRFKVNELTVTVNLNGIDKGSYLVQIIGNSSITSYQIIIE